MCNDKFVFSIIRVVKEHGLPSDIPTKEDKRLISRTG